MAKIRPVPSVRTCAVLLVVAFFPTADRSGANGCFASAFVPQRPTGGQTKRNPRPSFGLGPPVGSALGSSETVNNIRYSAKRADDLLDGVSDDDDDHDHDDDNDHDDDDVLPPPVIDRTFDIGGLDSSVLRVDEIRQLKVPQLKQQLRLRGLKVSGRKQELVDRLVEAAGNTQDITTHSTSSSTSTSSSSNDKDDVDASATDKHPDASSEQTTEPQFVDVTEFLDEQDVGKKYRSIGSSGVIDAEIEQDADGNFVGNDEIDENDVDANGNNPETWGSSAKIVDDYEGQSPVVDGLSRTTIEFMGSNQTETKAYVVASRDALKPFLEGATNRTGNPEERLQEIQTKREKAAKRPVHFEDQTGLDDGDEVGNYDNILHRDFSDWGKYTATGAQLSAQEVQGVILLSDVYGAFSDDTKLLAEKIAFECQPVVVMVPDLFRDNPWEEDENNPGHNIEGLDYEEWRSQHDDVRVSVDIRSSAAVLRDQYGVSSITVWGMCYGGGRALEIGAGYLPRGQVHDVDGSVGPPLVDPTVVIAWYPTRYDANLLYGKGRQVQTKGKSVLEEKRGMAVMAVFAGNDNLPGATPDDADRLRSLLQEDDRVKDLMVKVFPNQDHGFVHIGLAGGGQDDLQDEEYDYEKFVDDEFGGAGRLTVNDGEAEVACLLSTSFMETYARVFLPTTGPPINLDEAEAEWSRDLNMKDLDASTHRDIRQELEDSLSNHVEPPMTGRRIDPTDESQREEMAQILREMEPEGYDGPFKIEDDDELEVMYAKLKAADPSFQLF